MTAKPDFSQINTGRIFGDIEQATGKKRQQSTASQEEAEIRAAEMRTQGRKGCKAPRMYLSFALDNYDYLRIMARATGRTYTGFVNSCIEEHRRNHPEAYEKAREVIAALEGDKEAADQ